MMLHEKVIPGQFLLGMTNDITSSFLNGTPPSKKLEVFGSYNYHPHLHQQQQQQPSSPLPDEEVLDLSRRCDSVETRKTPSPYNSTSSFGTASPSTHCESPSNLATPTSAASSALISNKLLLSQTTPQSLPQRIPSLYPLYYPTIKQEIVSPPPTVNAAIPNPLPLFKHTPAIMLQQTFNGTTTPPAAYSSQKFEEHKSSILPTDTSSVLYPTILNAATTGSVNSGKTTRPFNAYPRDPLVMAAHFAASDMVWNKRDRTPTEPYSTFRKRALDDLRDTNGGHRIITNPKMRRTNTRNSQNSELDDRAVESSDNDSSTGHGSSTDHPSRTEPNKDDDKINETNPGGNVKDEAYYERRRKNNAAAKKSRDRRRIKEDEIAIRAAYLERQNIELLCQIDALKKQLEILRKT